MINLPMKSEGAYDRRTVSSINGRCVQRARDRSNVLELNSLKRNSGVSSSSAANSGMARNAPAAAGPHADGNNALKDKQIPRLINVAKKGQKLPIESSVKISSVDVCLGWNIKNPDCDVDVSAFLLSNNKVIGDSWFVFYGQTRSPDGSTVFSESNGADRELITIDFSKLNASVDKIVFVLTINEAFQRKLNFSMVKDAYIRIINKLTGNEIVSFMMDEYYSNVTSMMIGEIYKHNNAWKFNAIGNGVAKDLAGLCELYGVQVD